MQSLSVDLIFADPPFNIGFKYDGYNDNLSTPDYLKWSRLWIYECSRILKNTGSMWLAIGDEYVAELNCIMKSFGLKQRNWVIWYYTFGVHQKTKFTRSHAHLLHFTKSDVSTFNRPLVPSARAVKYSDRRAAAGGKTPDDVWAFSPTDFDPDSDCWKYSRLCGTFKERTGHPCQMPQEILDKIIKVSSNPGDLVFDPFAGSGTTLKSAKDLGRRFMGIEQSEKYFNMVKERLNDC